MSKEENVIKYYVICNKLKNIIRTGWIDWNVKAERLESVAEHIYGTQMLAIAILSEYEEYKDLNKMKIIFMLAIHELGETIIGDLTQFQITKEEKQKLEHEAVRNILKNLLTGEEINKLFIEFDEHKTKESKFAYMCDKLECDIQSKLYEEYVDLNKQENNKTFKNKEVQELLKENSWSTMWLKFGQNHYPYDKNFMKISNFVIENDIKGYQK